VDEREIIASLVQIAEEEEVYGIEVVVCPEAGDPASGSRYAITLANRPDSGEEPYEQTPAEAADGVTSPEAAALASAPTIHLVVSPMVGTFHRGTERGGPPIVEVGDAVTMGQTLGYVESLKVLRDLTAGVDGTVRAILAGDDEPVDYGRALFELEPRS
jgi:acetyl-CoA carboxylase biotin carboxyl carrier protein